jgi:hypothetical protein
MRTLLLSSIGSGRCGSRLFRQMLPHFLWFCLALVAPIKAGQPSVGPNGVIVQSRFGGQIFGFDIDQAGTEGILAESQRLDNNTTLAAVETFDQRTGRILKVIAKTITPDDDFVCLGVTGNSVGLIEREQVKGQFNVVRTFGTLNPLSGNRINGRWSPPVGTDHLVGLVSRSQGTQNAVWTLDLSSNFMPTVFSTDVGANTFGPVISINDQDFSNFPEPGFAYDATRNRAILGHAFLGNPFIPGWMATVDLTAGTFTKFRGVGVGDVNGLAYDPATDTACATTEIDFSASFYNIASQTGFKEPLPGATQQFFAGAAVEFDAVNRLFLVAQEHSSTASSGSSIHVYDTAGNVIESLNGFSFSNAFNVVPAHIAINPSRRIGFVDGPDEGVTQLQGLSY